MPKISPRSSAHLCMVSAYPPDKGRLGEYCFALTNALVDKGLTIRIGSDSPTASVPNVEVAPLWKPDNIWSLLRIPMFVARSRSRFALFNIHFAVFGRGRIANLTGIAMMTLTSMLGRLMHYKTVVIVHNLPDVIDTRFFGLKRNLVNRIGFLIGERLLFSCDATIVTLRQFKKMLEKRFRRRVEYLPHGSWYSSDRQLPTSGGRRHLLFFGLVSPTKNMNLVAEVFSKLRMKHGDIRLRLVATPHQNFPEASRQLDVFKGMPGVEQRGYAEEHEYASVFEGCFAIVLPYMNSTGTSGVLHLATGFGLPIIATNTPEFRELQSDGPGLILADSADEMVKALDRMLTDPAHWAEMSRGSLQFSKLMRWDNIASGLLDVMKRIETR